MEVRYNVLKVYLGVSHGACRIWRPQNGYKWEKKGITKISRGGFGAGRKEKPLVSTKAPGAFDLSEWRQDLDVNWCFESHIGGVSAGAVPIHSSTLPACPACWQARRGDRGRSSNDQSDRCQQTLATKHSCHFVYPHLADFFFLAFLESFVSKDCVALWSIDRSLPWSRCSLVIHHD